jgi:DNA polymerase III alpha subunit (gram-positive type)
MLDGTKTIMTVYDYLDQKVQGPVDYSDLLRWQWVQAVSALDKFIHDIVRVGMLDIYTGRRNPTNKYLTFTIDLKTHLQIIQDSGSALSTFERQILQKNGYQAFQDPDKISDALSYIWDEKNKWKVISDSIRMSNQILKRN